MPKKRTKRTVTRKTKKTKTSEEISAMQAFEMYNENFFVCNAEANYDPLPAKELLEPVRTLKRKSASDWTERDVMPLAEILAGRIAIDGVGENVAGASAYDSISEDLSKFVLEHPKIRSIIDPIYVTIDLTTCEGNLPPAVAAYPPFGSPHPPLALFPGTNHVFVFVGPGASESAQHFMGWLQGTYAGLRSILHNSPIPAILH
ncbi:hypothetical protein C1645_754245 [Glomus cerebriforme]|uniref:Uncharacterized protein n=1 Tax=Glomus cerebriforme TaxID=658196 RepID=A0A397TJV7_9GLOM|nr:hypothetical protein C1645_754245 [Glomus cerebriforme]